MVYPVYLQPTAWSRRLHQSASVTGWWIKDLVWLYVLSYKTAEMTQLNMFSHFVFNLSTCSENNHCQPAPTSNGHMADSSTSFDSSDCFESCTPPTPWGSAETFHRQVPMLHCGNLNRGCNNSSIGAKKTEILGLFIFDLMPCGKFHNVTNKMAAKYISCTLRASRSRVSVPRDLIFFEQGNYILGSVPR